jgi:3-oxoadipate enol-lactonase
MTFQYQGKQIYYESHGLGKPLLLLNGIMMTCASWAPFLKAFTESGTQVILLDLMDQGQTSVFEEGYDIADQASLCAALLDHMGIEKADVLGTSYGGTVALTLALNYPDKVNSLLLAATRAWTDPLFRDMCESWIHALATSQAFYTATIPLFYGATFQVNSREWMADRRKLLEETVFTDPDFLSRMKRLIISIQEFDLRDQLHHIACPCLLLTADEDLVMMPWEQERIAQAMPNCELMTLRKTGHVLFQERPALFISIVMGWVHHRSEPS